MSATASISIWLDSDGFKLYVKLNDRMDNRDFHEKFLAPLKVLGFRFDASKVAHGIEIGEPEELGLLIRQLELNFRVGPLEKEEIMYWLGLHERPKKANTNMVAALR
ncbi:MAG TPA: hypothetical protein VMC84_08005 [Methanocella sp.]|uniref:hypothetical protein n=1 Tax=Methanocella sp. TaxID=2052833 RepID=UPI002BACA86A|nr:hypothetical protein [Methanocella sp.]HTY91103.1 hypothetical protein [Methanocella sp.]